MKTRTQYSSRVFNTWQNLLRRKNWFVKKLTPSTAFNFSRACLAYLLRTTRLQSLPVALKVDISPVCNLRCPFCVHGTTDPESRSFHKSQRMSLENFQRLLDEVKGKTSSISLYYLGDPLTHPQLNEICALANRAGIFTYVSTNFSFKLTDAQIENLVTSGLSHLKVCVDGLTQEVYEQTRTGGRIATVLDNLERVCRARERLGTDIGIEVQYICYEQNIHELKPARELVRKMGIDEFTTFRGADYTMKGIHPDHFDVTGAVSNGIFSNCYWPYFFMVIKWNGDVIPCCSFRQDEQYDPNRPRITTLGNVFETSVAEVWNSKAYQETRRFVTAPKAFLESGDRGNTFCYGCKQVCKRQPKAKVLASGGIPQLPVLDQTSN